MQQEWWSCRSGGVCSAARAGDPCVFRTFSGVLDGLSQHFQDYWLPQLIRIFEYNSFLSPFCFQMWQIVNFSASWCSFVEDNYAFTMGHRFHQPGAGWEEECCPYLLGMVVDMWVCIRGFSQATAWMERYKSAQKKNLQKTKALRKKLNTYYSCTCMDSTDPS